MNEGFAVCGTVCSVSPPRRSAVSRAALAAGIVLALSLALLFGFAPKAWADLGEPSPELVYSSSQRANISWTLDVYKSQDNGGVYSVDQTKDGVSSKWQYRQGQTGNMDLQSGYVDASGNMVPSLYTWSTYYKPFSLYVDGIKVAWSDFGGEIGSISVRWDGMMDFLENPENADSSFVYGNLDLRISGQGRSPVSTQDYYRPMGSSKWLGDSWNLHPGALEQNTTGVYDGGSHNIELVLYDRVETPTLPDLFPNEYEMKPPVISLKFDDGTAYEEGTWTNKDVAVEATTVAGDYREKFYVVLFQGNSCVEVARSGWATLPFKGELKARYVVNKSTTAEGEMYFGGLFGGDSWPTSPKGLSKFVKVDKEKPVISSVSISGNTPVVSASDALSGVASIEGRKSASDEWVPISEVSLSADTTSLYVKVTDNAGNSEMRMMYFPSNPDPVDPPSPTPDPGTPPDSGDDTPGRGDGFKTQRAA